LFFIPTKEDEKQDGEEISDDEQEQSNFVDMATQIETLYCVYLGYYHLLIVIPMIQT
jgi:hypothetical protein